MKKEKRKEYALLLEQEQMHWMQKSRVNWIIHGERNTKFYHTITKKRRIRNRITQVEKTSGVVTEDPKEVEDTFLQAFKECFGEEEAKHEEQIMTYLQDIEIPKLNNDHLDKLNEPFTEEEIRMATFQLGPTKAPGIDGKPAVFYQTYWDIVGDLTSKTALDFLNRGHILKELNKTLIALIPKRKDPSKVSDYRPISLCNGKLAFLDNYYEGYGIQQPLASSHSGMHKYCIISNPYQ
ncbi:hypothetical protein COLO4_21865 [Corchorus olitorius]|uniref:Reverse transcriptase n=1 Tax=Corchorus olitorius TaxID=93759 RepID=A0A1R3IQ96_9ROSI|nr:hypothetical protein COLO4_21865 [Corchorus olitorius]